MRTATLSAMSGLGEMVRRLREARGWTAEQLEERAGMGAGQVSRLESGRNRDPRPKTLEGLARALGVSVDELLLAKAGAQPTTVRTVERDDVYPSRAQAIALLRGKVDDETLDALRFEQLKSAEDPGLKHWTKRARELQNDRDSFGHEGDEVSGLKPKPVTPAKATTRRGR